MITQATNPGQIVKKQNIFLTKFFCKSFFQNFYWKKNCCCRCCRCCHRRRRCRPPLLGTRSALVTQTSSDSYRLRFSTKVLKLSSGHFCYGCTYTIANILTGFKFQTWPTSSSLIEFREEVVEVRGNLSILAGYKAEEISKTLQALFKRALLVLSCAKVLLVDFLGFV